MVTIQELADAIRNATEQTIVVTFDEGAKLKTHAFDENRHDYTVHKSPNTHQKNNTTLTIDTTDDLENLIIGFVQENKEIIKNSINKQNFGLRIDTNNIGLSSIDNKYPNINPNSQEFEM